MVLQRKEKSYFMNNHLNFKVMYHEDLETGTARVVGFEVIPLRFEQLSSFHYLNESLLIPLPFSLSFSFDLFSVILFCETMIRHSKIELILHA